MYKLLSLSRRICTPSTVHKLRYRASRPSQQYVTVQYNISNMSAVTTPVAAVTSDFKSADNLTTPVSTVDQIHTTDTHLTRNNDNNNITDNNDTESVKSDTNITDDNNVATENNNATVETATPPITLTIHGPLRWWSDVECNKHFATINLQYKSLFRVNRKSNDVTLYFDSESEKQAAEQLLAQHSTLFGDTSDKKFRLKDTPVDIFKRKQQFDKNDERRAKRQRSERSSDTDSVTDTVVKPTKTVVETVCPLYSTPYDKQLQYKRTVIAKLFRSCYKRLTEQYKTNIQLKHAVQGMICNIDEIVASPTTNGYRNKCEFNCSYNSAGLKTAGFQIGGYNANGTVVEECTDCPNVPNIAKHTVALFNQFIRVSEYVPYNRTTKQGVYRMLTVRNSEANKQLMLCIQLCSASLTDEQLNTLKHDLTQYFTTHMATEQFKTDYNNYTLTSLLLRIHDGQSDVCDDSVQPIVLHGQSYITEQLLNLQFNITLTSFFQVNIRAAELLYTKAAEYAQCHNSTILFDICCGTGTIGISMSNHVKQLIGLEIVESAVIDARNNAKLNHIDNCIFIAGKAEETLQEALKQYGNNTNDISVIVDPPRAGLHPKVLRLLRNTRQLKRLVYVSCNVKSMIVDIEKICKPATKEWRHEPFIPVKATLFDMFPHCEHTECVMVLER